MGSSSVIKILRNQDQIMQDKESQKEIEKKIGELEAEMLLSDFWADKSKAQTILKELAELKDKKSGFGKYDKGPAILSIISGAGGDDASPGRSE